MSPTSLAQYFSNGQFELTFEHIAEDAVWEVVGESRFEGRSAILENCNRVGAYFDSVATRFTTLNVITENHKVAVSGTAAFFRDNQRLALVSACDVYLFNEQQQIQTITSYCIQLP